MRWWDGSNWGMLAQDHPAQRTPAPPVTAYFAPTQRMVTKSPMRPQRTFHLLMSLLTCGVWALFVWLPIEVIALFAKDKSVTRFR